MTVFTLPWLMAAIVFTPGQSEIVVAPDAVSVVRVAADEAKEFISQSLGADVPIVNAPSDGKTSLILGANRWSAAAGVTTNGLRRDAFRIKAAGNRVYVVGIDDAGDAYKARKKGGIWLQNGLQRATCFGVYEFLERFVGVRFYFPGELGTVVPKRRQIKVDEGDFTDAPVYLNRHYTIYDGGEYFEGSEAERKVLRHPGRTLSWWRNRMQTEYVPCCHGQNKFQYMERFADSHPEYFALLPDGRRHNSPKITSPGHPGQICHSSKIWDEIYADAKSYLMGEPASVRKIPVDSTLPNAPKRYGWGSNCQGGKYVDVMPQDGMIQCSCPACQAYYRSTTKVSWASDLIWPQVARLANRLKAEGVPGYVCNLAYSKYRRVPKCDIPDNVKVMVAERGPWTERDPEERAREIAEVKAWNEKLGHKVWMWTYSGKFARLNQPGIPPVTPKAIGKYYQLLAPWITGGYEETDSERYMHNYLNQYVLGKVMWNPAVDVDAILTEHHRLMFGKAAGEMAKFFNEMEEIWLTQVAGKTIDTPLGPQSQSPSKRILYTKVYSPAVIARWEGLFDRALAKVAAASLEARRIALMRRELLEPLKRAIDDFAAGCAKAEACRVKGGNADADAIVIDRDISNRKMPRDAKAPVNTTVKVWKARDGYHFVFDCEEPNMESVRCAERENDDPNTWNDNGIELFLNPSGDRIERVQMMLSSAGKFADLRNGDVKWNSGATAKAERTEKGWRGTIVVPLAALPNAKAGGFPMNFARDRVLSGTCTFITWGLPDIKDYGDIDNYGVVMLGDLEIVMPTNAVGAVRYAAKEAKEILSQSLGVEVPVVEEPTGFRPAVYLGPSRWADEAGVTTNGLRRDAFRIRSVPGKGVFIVGIDDPNWDAFKAIRRGGIWYQNYERATLFGVYEFLERFVGVRFYFPGELGTVVPKHERIELPPADITETPRYTVRRYTIYDKSPYFEGGEAERKVLRHPMKTLQWWRNRQETEYLPCCHGSTKFKYMERFAESHPEYFALLKDGRRHNSPKITYPGHPGQLCHTSKIWDEIYADAKSYLLGEPASVRQLPVDSTLPNAPKKYGWGANCQWWGQTPQSRVRCVDVMPQDGMIKCSCPDCQAYYQTAEAVSWASDLVWRRTAEVGQRLKAENVPGYICNLAYSKYRHVPKCDIPDNVMVMLAERGPWTENDPKERARELAEIKAWNAKLGRKVWMWTYSGKFARLDIEGIPPVTPKAIGRYYQMLEPWIFGAYEETESERFMHNYLNYYVFGKVCWNPQVNVEALVAEHHRVMFGRAESEMAEFFDVLERLWIEKVAGETIDTSLGPQSRSPSVHELFTQIYTPAVIDRWESLFASGTAKVGADSLEGRRLALIRREILEPLAKQVRDYNDMINVEKGLARDRASTAVNLIDQTKFKTLTLHHDEPKTSTVSFYFKDKDGKPTIFPNRKYRLSYCMKYEKVVPASFGAGAGTNIWDDKNVWFPKGSCFSGTQDWIYQAYEFVAGPRTGIGKTPYIYLRLSNATGTVWFDHVRLEEVK